MTNFFGWQPSLLLQDLSTGTQAGAMNIHMNQALADMQARSTLYMTPTMSWNSFIPYGVPNGGMDYLIDPNYTIGQWQWNQNNQNSIWGGAFSNMGMPQMNWNNPFNNPWNQGNNNTPTASNKTEKAFQTKYQKLEKLVKALTSDDSPLTGSRKDELKSVLSAKEGKTWKEKFENLKDAYNEIPKSDIKDFLATEAACTLSVNGKDVKKNSFYQKLQNVGYEFENSEIDAEILPLHTTLSGLSDDNADASHNSILGSIALKAGTYDVLDVISSWNNSYKNENIIQCFAKQYSKMKDESSKSKAVSSALMPIVNSLLTQAKDLQNGLDGASKGKMTKSIDAVNKALDGTINFTELSKAFNNLYLQTRLAAVDSLRAEIKDYYGTIDSEVFNDKLFEDATIKDLKEEGFTDSEIKAAKVKAKVSNDVVREEKYNDEEKTASEHVKDMVNDGYLAKATATGIGGDVYYDKNTSKVYVIKKNEDDEEELHEVIGTKADAQGKVSATGTPETKKVTASDVAAESDKAKEEKAELAANQKAAEELGKNKKFLVKSGPYYTETNGQKRKFIIKNGKFVEIKIDPETKVRTEGESFTPEEIKEAHENAITIQENSKSAYADGKDAHDKLNWSTDSKHYTGINSKLSGLNKDTVLTYVQGFYDDKGTSPEGMIEHLDDEWDGGKITMDSKKNLINSFLEKAKELGFEKDEDYKAIQEIMQYYEPGQEYAESKDFNHTNGGFFESLGKATGALGGAAGALGALVILSNPGAWVIGGSALAGAVIGACCDRRTDNEVIDECMKSLMKKMQEKHPKEFQVQA